MIKLSNFCGRTIKVVGHEIKPKSSVFVKNYEWMTVSHDKATTDLIIFGKLTAEVFEDATPELMPELNPEPIPEPEPEPEPSKKPKPEVENGNGSNA